MKLFLISNMYPDTLSPGYGIFVKNMVDGLTKHGITTKYSSLIKGRSTNILIKIIKYIKFYCSICINFFKEYDAIYIHFPNHALPILLPLLVIRKRCIIVNLHGEDLLYYGKLGRILGKMNDYFLPNVQKIIVPSEYFKVELLKRSLCTEDKIFISPSGGINNQLFYPLKKHSKKKELCLGFVGRIDEGKGIKEFIEALHILNQKITCKAIIIGYGPYEQQLNKLIETLLISDKVRIIKGVNQDRLGEFYNDFDLFLFLSNRKTESLGLVGIEAMACGTPVIGTDIGGIPSYLIDGQNGFLIPTREVNSVVSAVLKYNRMSKEDKEIMQNNCIKSSEKYFKDKVSIQLAEVIYNLIKGQKKICK